ncbi:MAG: hypothetical protein JST84_16110 [Acidobacteria bacterium]|nr:hypothetical protein [Acidobacteriota bacterium]
MSGQVITIRGTSNDCWIVNRYVGDAARNQHQSFEDDWFDLLAEHCVIDYQEFFDSEVLGCPTIQFFSHRSPIVC